MPKMVLLASYLAVNGVDISANVTKIEVVANIEKKDVTVFTSLGWKEYKGGLKSGQVSFEVFNDFTDNELDEDMWTLFIAGDPVSFEARSVNTVASATNPKYTGSFLIEKWSPISGKVGDVNGASYSYETSGAITRGVA
jgi:hypothetical protein